MTLDAYANLDQFRLFLKLDPADGSDDADDLRELALEASSRAIDKACLRSFRPAGSSQSARVFTATPSSGVSYAMSPFPYSWITHYEVAIDDTVDTTATVAFDSSGNGDYTIAETGFRLAPTNNPDKDRPYDHLIFDRGVYPPMYPEAVQVTAIWDWTATPNTIVNATLLQASRFWHRIDAPFGISGSPDMQGELRLLKRLDVDVELMVQPFKKWWGAV